MKTISVKDFKKFIYIVWMSIFFLASILLFVISILVYGFIPPINGVFAFWFHVCFWFLFILRQEVFQAFEKEELKEKGK